MLSRGGGGKGIVEVLWGQNVSDYEGESQKEERSWKDVRPKVVIT